MKRKLFGAAGIAAFMLVSGAANAAVIWDSAVSHSPQIGTAASTLAASLSTSASSFSGGSMAGWTGATGSLSSGDVLFLGQASRTDLAGAANFAAISTFVAGGGTVISLWGDGPSATTHGLLSSLSGASLGWLGGGSSGTTNIMKTAAAAGTSFSSVAANLPGVSNFGTITTASLPAGSISLYESASFPGQSYVTILPSAGSGLVAFLAWDWCCSATPAERTTWDSALFAAATFSKVPEPGTLAILGLGLVGLGVARRKQAA